MLTLPKDAEADSLRPGGKPSSPIPVEPPDPTEELLKHPYFKEEYSLPIDAGIERIMHLRRAATTPSPDSTPPPETATTAISSASARDMRGKKRARARSKLDSTGLVGGDSDSSLTQESGDEGPPTPRESVVTATDGGTEDPDDVLSDLDEPIPGMHHVQRISYLEIVTHIP
jgi:MRG-binding protein